MAEDLAQESMLRLFSHEVDGSSHGVRAWLFKTATHLVRDRHRVDRNRQRLLEANPVLPAETASPEHDLERLEDQERARGALATLSDRDREILLMRYSGFSYKEIAYAAEVAATSIGTLLARAEKRFAQALEEEGKAA